MKKMLAFVFAVAALTVSAAWERVGSLQVADVSAQNAAVSRLGMFVGNPMASAALAAGVADLPSIRFFGPMRPNASVVVPLFVDVGGKPGAFEKAMLYPVSVSRAEFAGRHPGATDGSGALAVSGSPFGGGKRTYVVFSADGLWAGAGASAELARQALQDVAVAVKPMDGDILRLRLGKAAFKAALPLASGADVALAGSWKDLVSLVCGLRVSDTGVDLRGVMRAADGSKLASTGLKSLGTRPFSSVRGAVGASAQAEDAGGNGMLSERDWDGLLAIFRRNGIDVSTFLAHELVSAGERFSLDLEKLFAYVSGEGAKAVQKLDGAKLASELQAFAPARAERCPAAVSFFGFKGFESAWSVEERFAATLPEAAEKCPYSASFFSLSSLLRAVSSQALKLVPTEQREAFKPMLDQLGTETKRGIASMSWDDKGAKRFVVRVSADEIKGLGNFAGAAFTWFATRGAAPSSGAGSSVDVDDED